MIRRHFQTLKNTISDNKTIIIEDRRYVFFSPGLFLVLLGLAVLIAPRFVIALVATFFISIGILFSFVAWKFLQLKKKFNKLTQEFQGKVVLHGIQVVEPNDINKSTENSKKIIYH